MLNGGLRKTVFDYHLSYITKLINFDSPTGLSVTFKPISVTPHTVML